MPQSCKTNHTATYNKQPGGKTSLFLIDRYLALQMLHTRHIQLMLHPATWGNRSLNGVINSREAWFQRQPKNATQNRSWYEYSVEYGVKCNWAEHWLLFLAPRIWLRLPLLEVHSEPFNEIIIHVDVQSDITDTANHLDMCFWTVSDGISWPDNPIWLKASCN